MANNDQDLFGGLGQLFGGVLGGLAQGVGQGLQNAAQNQGANGANPFANLGANGANPFGNLGEDGADLGNLFGEAFSQLGGELGGAVNKVAKDKSKEEGEQPFRITTKATEKTRKKDYKSFQNSEILNKNKLNAEKTKSTGCYSLEALEFSELSTIRKIDFHGDSYFSDDFVHQLQTSARLSFADLEVVDLRGCCNLTDIGVHWLAGVLSKSKQLDLVFLGGCVQITEQGLSDFRDLNANVSLSLVSTGVTSLPNSLWRNNIELDGCPLLKQKESDTEPVPMQSILIHPSPNSVCSLASVLSTKQKGTLQPVKYIPSWECGSADFSIMESPIDHPTADLLSTSLSQQILIPVNLDDDPEKGVQHTMNVVEHYMNTSDWLKQSTGQYGRIIKPVGFLNAEWDEKNGRILVRNVTGEIPFADGYESDEEENMCMAAFEIPLDKSHPSIDFVVDCDPATTIPMGLGLFSDSSHIEVTRFFRNGDVVSLAIKDPEQMEHETMLHDGDPEDLVLITNKHRGYIYISYCWKNSTMVANKYNRREAVIETAPAPEELKEYLEEGPYQSVCVMDIPTDAEDADKFNHKKAMEYLSACAVCLVIMTPEYLESDKCKQELEMAVLLKKSTLLVKTEQQQTWDWQKTAFANYSKENEDVHMIDVKALELEEGLSGQNSGPTTKKFQDLVKSAHSVVEIDDSWSGGSMMFMISTANSPAINIQFLNYHPPPTSKNKLAQEVSYVTHGVEDPRGLIDHANGIIRCIQEDCLFPMLHAISENNSEFKVKFNWEPRDDDAPNDVRVGLFNRNEDYEDGNISYSHTFTLKNPLQDIILVKVEDVKGYVARGTKYNIRFYLNGEVVHTEKMSYGKIDSIPSFGFAMPKGFEAHLQDYTPPSWFVARMRLNALLPDSCFVQPDIIGKCVSLTNHNAKFPDEPIWNDDSEQSCVFLAQTSLTQHHPSFTVRLVNTAEKQFFIGALGYVTEQRSHFDDNGYRPSGGKAGDTFKCALQAEGLQFDEFGLPVLGQMLKLVYTVNDKEVEVKEFKYAGGGLHPAVAGNGFTVEFEEMDLEWANHFSLHPPQSQKQFVLVGTSEEKTHDECNKTMEKLDLLFEEQLKAHHEEIQVTKDATKDEVVTSYAGGLVKTRLAVQKTNWEHVNAEVSSLTEWWTINLKTMEGVEELCDSLRGNHCREMSMNDYIHHQTDAVRQVIDLTLNEGKKNRIISCSECLALSSLTESQVVALLKLLHGWGKVILVNDIKPWIVILDVEWFVSMVHNLQSSSIGEKVGDRVRCLHSDTPVLNKAQFTKLTEDLTESQRQLLLEVLIERNLLMRLTSLRSSAEEEGSYLVNPRHLMNPTAPLPLGAARGLKRLYAWLQSFTPFGLKLAAAVITGAGSSQFYNAEDSQPDMFKVTMTFTLPDGAQSATWYSVLSDSTKVSPPVAIAPTYLVTQVGATQVVLMWRVAKSGSKEVELVLVASSFLPLEEVACQSVVSEYTFTVLNIFDDVISNVLISAKTAFFKACEPANILGNLSVCSVHRWSCDETDPSVSVCSLCGNCSELGMKCKFNRVFSPYDISHCQCGTSLVCCQDCGLCRTCVQRLWTIRSKLRPSNLPEMKDGMESANSHRFVKSRSIMSPTNFNEVTVFRGKSELPGENKYQQAQEKGPADVRIGLLSEDEESFIQLFPGRALFSRKDQNYNQQSRRETNVDTESALLFDCGDVVTVHLSQPNVQPAYGIGLGNLGEKTCISYISKTNCSLSRTTHVLSGHSTEEVGVLVSYPPDPSKRLYFDVEIISSSGDEMIGVGMARDTSSNDIMAHGPNMLTDCKAWAQQWWQAGDVLGCGAYQNGDTQELVFTHNDQVVCRHSEFGDQWLLPSVLVKKGQAVRILNNDLWMLPKEPEIKPATIHTKKDDEEHDMFLSSDGHVAIYPKRKLVFDQQSKSNVIIFIENSHPEKYLMFKIRTTSPKEYISLPNRGLLRPNNSGNRSSAKIEINYNFQDPSRSMEKDKFQVVYAYATKEEVGGELKDESIGREITTQLLDNLPDNRRHKPVILQCVKASDNVEVVEEKEAHPAHFVEKASIDMAEPSYQVTIVKNGNRVASYWIPRGEYHFAIERATNSVDDRPQPVHGLGLVNELDREMFLHIPKLPSDTLDGFRVGMRVNVEVDQSILSESFVEAIKSVCPNPASVLAVCQVDSIEHVGNQTLLNLSFHGSPAREQPDKRFSLKLPADSPQIQPVDERLKTSEEVSVSVEEGNIVQLVGFSANTCRYTPDYLPKGARAVSRRESLKVALHGKTRPDIGTRCENLLFGAHRMVLARDGQSDMDYTSPTPAYLFLPSKLSEQTLLYPSLQQLHDFSNMMIYHVSQPDDAGPYSGNWHLMDIEGYSPEGFVPYSAIYRNLPVLINYLALAANKVRLPSHRQLVSGSQEMQRYKVETLLQSMLQTYTMTAQLLAIPRYMKVGNILTEIGKKWKPEALLPLDYSGESIISTYRESSAIDPFSELNQVCVIHCDEDSSQQSEILTEGAAFVTVTPDITGTLAKMPHIRSLVVTGKEAGDDVLLKLPELTELTNRSVRLLLVQNCPKLVRWEGPLVANIDEQLDMLSRCNLLEELRIHENKIEKLPRMFGGMTSLTTLHLNQSHVSSLPTSFAFLKNLRDLKIIGPLAEWSRTPTFSLNKEDIKRRFPFIPDKNLDSILTSLGSCWDGTELRIRSADQHGKFMSAFYLLSSKLGLKEDSVHGGFPRVILQLPQLRHLHLSYQGIRYVPQQISRLINLEVLELEGCYDLDSLPYTIGFLPLKKLSLQGCLSLRTPSREVVDRGTEAVMAYLKQMARGKRENWRTKLMLVGIGGAGKTTLLRALKSYVHSTRATKQEEITHGIDIDTWSATDEKNYPGKRVVFSAWDFAGQTVFYNTHQYFMSDRAVYLLVWSCRQGYDNSGLDFWLSSIQCHSPDAPVFVVATHADQLTTDVPRGQLKESYPQIQGFFFVGSLTGKGIPELKEAIMTAALELDYMGEDVPAVYLDLEQKILALRNEETPYLEWSVVKNLAMEAGIFDDKDVGRAVQFLQQIGSVQYFDYALLRDYVVINPQWIVSAMACVVTFKDSVIQNGRLYHSNVSELWKDYPPQLHEWLLRLTEIFDLTFQINKDLSLVPCLLPNEQPVQAKWPPKNIEDAATMLIVYNFKYLPTGLFNRLQARLFEFSNGKAVWKKGSILEKKGHYAYIKHERDQILSVHVIGRNPENLLILIHETLEDLINLSYRGIQFEYRIPCPDCVKEVGMDNPAMFEASLVREASKCSAPYLQCRRLFHTVPLATAKAMMPPNDNLELDLQLQRSMQSLGEMRNSMQTDVFMLFSDKDFLNKEQAQKLVDPRRVHNDIKDEFKCYFDENMKTANIQPLMVSIQEAKVLLIFISNNFVKDERCSQLLQYAHTGFADRLCVVNLSADYGWKQETAGFILSEKVFINMKMFDERNYKDLLSQLKEKVREKLGVAGGKQNNLQSEPSVFISYCWNNSKSANASRKLVKKEATICDPREFKKILEEKHRIRCWLDVEQTGKRGLFEDITEGLRAADLIIAFVSNEYLNSANCMMELRFAVSTLKIPAIFIAVGIGMEWQYEEIGTLQRNCNTLVLDMRTEMSESNIQTVTDFIKKNTLTPSQREEKLKKMRGKMEKMSIVELANASYHEEFELAQRKLMRRLTYLSSHLSVLPYPRIFIIDFVDNDKTAAAAQGTGSAKKRPGSASKTLARRRSTLTRRESALTMKDIPGEENKLSLDSPLCIRFLCEHDEGWHETRSTLELTGLTVQQKQQLLERFAPYLARMLTILKYSSIPLNCFKGEEGTAFKEFLVRLALEAQDYKDAFEKAYINLLDYIMEKDKDRTRGDLKQCVLSGGRIRWMCPDHQKGYRVTVLNTDVSQRAGASHEDVDFVKGITNGLKELGDIFTEHIPMPPPAMVMNVADFFHDIFKDGTAREIGKRVFNTIKEVEQHFNQHFEKNFEEAASEFKAMRQQFAAKKEDEEKKGKAPKPKPRRQRQSSAASNATVRSEAEDSVTNSRPPSSQANGSRTGTPKPSGEDKRAAFRNKGRRATLEQREAAQRMMQQQMLNGLMGGGGQQGMMGMGMDGENTSQACVII